MKTVETVNGVAVDELFETMDAIKEKPEIASFQFRAKNTWIKGGHNRTTITEFYGACAPQVHQNAFVLEEDEPPVLLGEDQGANPVEYVLTALAGCLTSALVFHAAARGIHLEQVESELTGDLDVRGFLGMDNNIRNGYRQIHVNFTIKADDATDEELQELIQIAQQRSPVHDIVTHPVPVEVSVHRK